MDFSYRTANDSKWRSKLAYENDDGYDDGERSITLQPAVTQWTVITKN